MYNLLDNLNDNIDLKYRTFNARTLVTVKEENVIGVRVPMQRKIAHDFMKYDKDGAYRFLNNLPHKYFEENQVHGFMIQSMKDYDEVIKYLTTFVPYIDNWATCDTISPRVFKKHPPEIELLKSWIKSDKPFTIRFGICQLMFYYTKALFKTQYLDLVLEVNNDNYYVNMMRAWFFQVAIQNQYESTIRYIEDNKLDKFTHNKAIQKCVESYRISDDKKDYLKSLRRK